jgi:dihydrofolate reductase
MWPGPPRLVRSLVCDGLLDEFDLNICPIVVGSGTRLFDEMTDQTRLQLLAIEKGMKATKSEN